MSWKEALARWLGRARGTKGEAGPAVQERPNPDRPMALPLPAAGTLALLGPLSRFLDERRRRLAGWGWGALSPLPAWAGERARVPAPGRMRTGWRGFRKSPSVVPTARTRLLSPRLLAFARERAARYRYQVDTASGPAGAAPERGLPVPWFGILQGMAGVVPPPPEDASRAAPCGEPFPAGEPEAEPSRERPPARSVREAEAAPPPAGTGDTVPVRRAPQRTPDGLRAPTGRVRAPSHAPAVDTPPGAAERRAPAPTGSIGSRLRRFWEQLGTGLGAVRRPSLAPPREIPGTGRPSAASEPPLEAPVPRRARHRGEAMPSAGDAGPEEAREAGAGALREAFPSPGRATAGESAPSAAPAQQPEETSVPPSGASVPPGDRGEARPAGRDTTPEHGPPVERTAEAPRHAQAARRAAEPYPLARQLPTTMTSGTPLPPSTRRFLEAVLRRPLKGLRIHTGAEAARTVRDMGAAAATLGRDILLSPDFPGLETPRGLELLAHEAVHAIQAAERGPAREGAPEAREEESEALRAQAAVRGLFQASRLRVSVPAPPPPTFPELPLLRVPERAAAAPLPVVAVPSRGPFRRAPAEETVAPAPATPTPPAEPSPAVDIEALAEEVYRRLRYRLELEREQRGIE